MMPLGSFSFAWVAGPPSPLKPVAPVPAIVRIVPSLSTSRMRSLAASAMTRCPLGETARLWGQARSASSAGPPSPEKCRGHWSPLPAATGSATPATVEIVPVVSTTRITWLKVSAMYMLPAPSKVIMRGW